MSNLREKAIADSQKTSRIFGAGIGQDHFQDMRAVLYNLLESEKQKAMLANVNEDFALEVIDPAVTPETREKPKRKLIVALGRCMWWISWYFCRFFCSICAKVKI